MNIIDSSINNYKLQSNNLDISLNTYKLHSNQLDSSLNIIDSSINTYKLQSNKLDISLNTYKLQSNQIDISLNYVDISINSLNTRINSISNIDNSLNRYDSSINYISNSLYKIDVSLNKSNLDANKLDISVNIYTSNVNYLQNALNSIDTSLNNNIHFSNNLDLSGSIRVLNNLSVNGSTIINNTLSIGEDAFIKKGLGININRQSGYYLDISGNSKFEGDVHISGNLTIDGSSIELNTSSLTVNDNVIAIADGNTNDLLPIGFIAHTKLTGSSPAITTHTGLVRNPQDNSWWLFNQYTNNVSTGFIPDNTNRDNLTLANIYGLYSEISGNLVIKNNANISGVTTLANSLSVFGEAILNTLVISGPARIRNTLDISGSTRIQNSLSIANDTRLNTITVSGATTMASTLSVANDTRLNTITVSGATVLSSTLDISGSTRIQNTLSVSNNTRLNTITVSGATTLAFTLDISGSTRIQNSLSIANAVTIVGNLSVANAISVSGLNTTTLITSSTNTLGGNTTIQGTLSISSNSIITGNVGIGANNLNEKLDISGNLLVRYGNSIIIPDSVGSYGSGNGSYITNNGETLTISMRNTSNGIIAFRTGASERLRIATNGLVTLANTTYYVGLNPQIDTTVTVLGLDCCKTGSTTGSYNTAIGYFSQSKMTSGAYNTSTGAGALRELTTGTNNTAMGLNSLVNCTTGSSNTAIGALSLLNDISGSSNTAIGYGAGANANRDFSISFAGGVNALNGTTTGQFNVGIGVNAGIYNTTGTRLTIVGHNAGYGLLNSSSDTIMGFEAMACFSRKYYPNSDSYNVAIGRGSMYDISSSSLYNTAVGSYTMPWLNSAIKNTAIGYNAGNLITTGNYNTLVGSDAGAGSLSTGGSNTYVGALCAYNNSGTNNTVLGYNALRGASGANASYNIAIGLESFSAVTTGSECIVIGYNAQPAITSNKVLVIGDTTGGLYGTGLYSSGFKLGIGTTNPLSRLHVASPLTASSTIGLNQYNLCIQDSTAGNIVNNGGSLVFGSENGYFAGIKGGLLDGGNNSVGNMYLCVRNVKTDSAMSTAMTIKPGGNVGIGTTSPAGLLGVNMGNATLAYGTSYIDTWDSTYAVFGNSGSTTGKAVGIGFNNGGGILMSTQPGNGAQPMFYNAYSHNFTVNNNSASFTINSAGQVGIGQYAGTGYQLDVLGSVAIVGDLNVNGSIYSSGGYTGSDIRIKTDISNVNIAEMLDKINMISVKSYKYKDPILMNNSQIVTGVIAQEILEILPESINLIQQVIPSILRFADSYTIDNSNNATIELANHGLVTSDFIRIVNKWTDDNIKNEIYEDVSINVIDKNTFNVVLTNRVFLDCSNIFIYGKRVDDFHAIDKNKIYMPLIGAVQELSKQNNQLKNTINTMKSQLDSLSELVQNYISNHP